MQPINIYNSQDVNVTIDDNGTPVDVYINSTPVDVYVSGGFATALEFYPTFGDFPAQGQGGILYIAEDTNYIYRWDGAYVQVGGGSLVWGQITGTLSNQTDLQTALDDKVPYTGATQNIDIGDNQLIADDGTNDSAFAPSFIGVEDSSGYSFLDPNGVYVADLSGQMEVNASGLVFPDSSIQTTAGITGVDWGDIQGTLANQSDLQTALDGKVDENTAITGATKTKITYDSKGLVTSGADAGISDITGLQTALDGKVPYTGATGNVDLGEYGASGGYYQFDVTPTTYTQAVGKMGWNDTEGTIEFLLKGGNVDLTIGEKLVARVVNGTGGNVLKSNYQVVKVTGAQGQRLQVNLAQANNDANSADTLGLIAENISNNQSGFIVTSGLVEEINTTGNLQSETWADGDPLYLSPTTAGKITNVKPQAPQHTVIIGFVVYAHANHGKIFVKVDNGYELDELHNVRIDTNTLSNGQVLKYNSTLAVWENNTDSAGTGTVTSIATSSPLTGGTITTSGTIGISQATTTTDGYLSSTDFTTFNNKQNALTNPVTGTGTSNELAYFSGTSAISSLSTATYPSLTELSYVKGVTSSIQTQLNGKQATLTNPVTGTGTSGQVSYFNGTSTVTGSNNLFWDNTNGRLGIGTAVPNNSLDITGTQRIVSSGNYGLTITRSGTSGISSQTYNSTGTLYYGVDNSTGGFLFTGGLAYSSFLGSGSNHALQLGTNSIVRQTIFNNGNVAIGTTTDSGAKLTTSGSITASSAIARGVYFNNTLVAAANNDVLVGLDINPTFTNGAFSGVSNYALRAQADLTGSNNVLVIKNTGTSSSNSPTLALDTNGTGADQPVDIRFASSNPKGIRIYASNSALTSSPSGAGFQMYSNSSTNLTGQIYFDSGAHNSAAIIFRTAITSGTIAEAMRIFSNKNIGIGVSGTDSGYKLDINGTTRVQDNLLVSKNQNVGTSIEISNTNSAVGASSILRVTSDASSGYCNFGKFSSTTTSLKTIIANDGFLYNTTAGDISILNDFATGKIKLTAGGSSTAQATLFSTGNLAIGTTSDTASAILTLSSTTKGFLPPRMTGAQGEAIASPAAGLMIYTTSAGTGAITSAGWWGYNGTTWVRLN